MKRRDWLRITGAGILTSSCVPLLGGGGKKGRWSEKTMREADQFMKKSRCKGWAAWEDGRLKSSWRPYETGSVMSVTKAIAMLTAVRAAGQGWLSVDEKVADTITEWRWDVGKQAITVQMLLEMTAGLEEGVSELYRRIPHDKGAEAIKLRLLDVPGTQFRYGPACWEVLGEVLRRKCTARGTSMKKFLFQTVGKIGLSPIQWKQDGNGEYFLSTGAELNITDMGRLGRVIARLATGKNTAGLKAEHFRKMTQVSRANPRMGGGIWRNGGSGREIEIEDSLKRPLSRSFWAGSCLSRKQPASMLVLVGSAGQRIYIWPESGQVVARLGYTPSWKDRPFLNII